jgi:hypothetical protein
MLQKLLARITGRRAAMIDGKVASKEDKTKMKEILTKDNMYAHIAL